MSILFLFRFVDDCNTIYKYKIPALFLFTILGVSSSLLSISELSVKYKLNMIRNFALNQYLLNSFSIFNDTSSSHRMIWSWEIWQQQRFKHFGCCVWFLCIVNLVEWWPNTSSHLMSNCVNPDGTHFRGTYNKCYWFWCHAHNNPRSNSLYFRNSLEPNQKFMEH